MSRSGETETRILRNNGEGYETRSDPTRNECGTSRSVKRFFFDAEQDDDGGSRCGSRSGGDRTGGAGEESDGTNAGYIVQLVLLRQRESQVFKPRRGDRGGDGEDTEGVCGGGRQGGVCFGDGG